MGDLGQPIQSWNDQKSSVPGRDTPCVRVGGVSVYSCVHKNTHVYMLSVGSYLEQEKNSLWRLETPSKCYLAMRIFLCSQRTIFGI